MKDNRIWSIAALSPSSLSVSVHSMNLSASRLLSDYDVETEPSGATLASLDAGGPSEALLIHFLKSGLLCGYEGRFTHSGRILEALHRS